ncbi:hypothetical protein ES707_15115 [subsurface metagenome]
MAKEVQPGEDIHIAPGITGNRDDSDKLVITVDSNGKRLYPENNIEHKIRIFERQVNGWFLERASTLLDEEDNGFVILMIATAYIEGVEQYRKGQPSDGKSRTFFEEGLKRIFGIKSCFEDKLYDLFKELRCGLFHNGMTGRYIRIHSDNVNPIDFSDSKIIKINQILFLEKVKEDFEQYLEDLKDKTKTELRDNFNKMYTFS